METPNFRLKAIGHYLSDSEELTLEEQLDALDAVAQTDPTQLVDNVEGVVVWHIFEGREVGDLLDIAQMLADDFREMYELGQRATN